MRKNGRWRDRRRVTYSVLATAALVAGSLACGAPAATQPDAAEQADAAPLDAGPGTVEVQILAFNDFHGALDPSPEGGGGAARLAGEIASWRTPNTVVVAAGDLIGGSPLVSGHFHDEPTIEVLNALGLDVSSVGNHEFDEGQAELRRMQEGGCHPVDGCQTGHTFTCATFQYLAANVWDETTGERILPGYAIRDVGGARIAFVGLAGEDTPAQTLAAAIPELAFADEVETLEALLPDLHAAGARIVVPLLHEGSGVCPLDGRAREIVAALDGVVPLVVTAHTHAVVDCAQGGVLVTQAGSHGAFLTRITITIELASQEVIAIDAETVRVGEHVDPAVEALVAGYGEQIAGISDQVIGTITADVSAAPNLAGERPMGDVIADAMLAASALPAAPAADVALMNPGGIRASLLFARSGSEPEDGLVTYGEAFAVQPFTNWVTTVTLTGEDLALALDAWVPEKPLQVAGLTYVWHASAAAGERVTPVDVLVAGVPLEPAGSYRVTVNSIVGDPIMTPSMANATDPVVVGVDIDLLTAYIAASSPLSPPPLDRTTRAE